MDNIFTIIYFFLIIYLYGLSANYIFRYTKVFGKLIYKELAKLCIGFSLYNFFIFVFGTARIPLMPTLMFIPPILVIAYMFMFKSDKINFPKIKNIKLLITEKPVIPLIMLIAVIVATTLLISGTFKYPYLEDGDPWAYASGAKYISNTKNYHNPDGADKGYNFYLFPHSTPTLAAHYGILTQISQDTYWIMKVFINIFIMMSFLSLFLFVYHFSKHEMQALIATLLLLIVPSFIGHFNFNYTLAVALIPVMLLGASLAKESKQFIVLAALLAASVFMSHQIVAVEAAIILIIFFIIQLIFDLTQKKKNKLKQFTKTASFRIILVGLLAIAFSFVYYGDFIASVDVGEWYEGRASTFISLSKGSVTYDIDPNPLSSFFVAKKVSLMDQQKGIGIFLFSFAFFAFILMAISKKKPNKDHIFYAIFFLFFFFFLWIFTGGIFKFSIQNYRWWSVLAISVALLSGWFLYSVWIMLKKKPIIRGIIFTIIIAGLIYTSAIPRYTVQSSYWGPGIDWTSNEEISGFVNLRNLPAGTSVYSACQPQKLVMGFSKESYPWIKEVREYNIFNNTVGETYNFLTKYNYEYMIISSGCSRINNNNTEINQLIQATLTSGRFTLYDSNSGYLLVKRN